MAQVANAAIIWIKDMAKDLGLSFQPKKTVRPMICLVFLRLEVNSVAMEAR